jgi:hypothetical protein
VYIGQPNAATAQRITHFAGMPVVGARSVAYSPDGTELLVNATGADGEESEYIVGVDGSNMRRLTDPKLQNPGTNDYDEGGSWQPCIPGVTRPAGGTTTPCLSVSANTGTKPAVPKSSVSAPAAKSTSNCGGRCGVTSATITCRDPSSADVTGGFTFKAPDNSSISALWRFSFFKSDGTLLRRFPKTGWYGPQGVPASRSMTKTQLYASTVAKHMLATVEDDNDPSNTWSKWATHKNC